MSNFKTVPNQKTITVHKQICGKGSLFAQINMNALKLAAQRLPAGPFKLWIYFAKNQDKYNFALSYTDAQDNFGFGRFQYDTAISTLIEEEYLIETKAGSNIYDFYEISLKDSTSSGNPNTTSSGNPNTTSSGNPKRNITYNNTNNITEPSTSSGNPNTTSSGNPNTTSSGNPKRNITYNNTNNITKDSTTPLVEEITMSEAAALGCTEWSVHWIDKKNGIFEYEGKRYKKIV